MKADKKGIDFIHSFEGCSLKPYLCPANVPTIGWGNTFYPNGVKVTMKDKTITQEEADRLFLFTLAMFEKDVTKLITSKVNQNQFNALLSFAYNVGTDIDQDNIPEGLGDSTLLKKVNIDPNNPSIAKEFLKWDKANGVVLPGLTRRRKEEALLYFTL
jgi:lysozyme